MTKGVDNVDVRAAKVEKHLEWVLNTISDIRRRDVDESYLTEEERLMVVVLQLKLRAAMPFARKLAASLERDI